MEDPPADRILPRFFRPAEDLLRLASIIALRALLSFESVAADVRRPNIQLIYSDAQSFNTLSCYPELFRGVKTPNIDALPKSRGRFQEAYLGSWRVPSRVAFWLIKVGARLSIENPRAAGLRFAVVGAGPKSSQWSV